MEIAFWLHNILFHLSGSDFISDIFCGKGDQNDTEGEAVLPFYTEDL